ncbi:MAG: hypothetical protein IJM21_12725 [Clostridia bacterium]|nr:hypothetical protein [Clostridia bacterium]
MSEFPRTEVSGVSLPRILIGSNWVLGYSHRSVSQDNMIRDRYSTKEAVADLVSAYLEHGVDAMMAPFVNDEGKPVQPLMDGIHEAEQRMGRKVILIDTPILNVDDNRDARLFSAKKIEGSAKNGATFCLVHHSSAEQLVSKNRGTMDRLDDYTHMIRENGMIPGLSAHMPELIVYSDNHPEYDVQTYIQIYNCMGFLMQIEVEGVRAIIEKAKHPVMTIKSMAAGRVTPYVGLTFSFASIRPCDMVTLGAHTVPEVHEDLEIALAAIERRYPTMEKRSTPHRTVALGGDK